MSISWYRRVFKGIEKTWEDYYIIEGSIKYNTMVDCIEFN